jgi:L-threonylcarbamoyladenylate synthase
MTLILKTNPAALPLSLKKTVEALQQGQCVALPTETVYGLAADASNPQAIEKIFILKNRPRQKSLIIHLHQNAKLESFVRLDTWSEKYLKPLMKNFWPGPLTVVLPAQDSFQHLANADQKLAIRSPQHTLFQNVLKKFGKPLAAPSANKTHQLTSICAQNVAKQFEETDLLILDGPTKFKIESTILEFHSNKQKIEVLRPGALSLRRLNDVLLKANLQPVIEQKNQNHPQAPGQELKHYQPQTPCFLIDLETLKNQRLLPKDLVILTGPRPARLKINPSQLIHLTKSFKHASLKLYETLNEAQKKNPQRILFVQPNEGTLQRNSWANTFQDRIVRMSENQILTALS